MRGSESGQQMPLSSADRGEIDLVALFREVGRRKWLVLLCTAGALALSTIAVNVLKPRYTAETRVFLENRDTEYTRIGREGPRGTDPLIDQDAVLSQVQLIQSRDIARAMIKRFNLGTKPEFDDVLNGIDPVTKVGVMLGLFNNPASVTPEERVLEKYFDKLKAFAVAKSRVVAIEFQSRDPELAAKLSDAIAEEYIRQLEQAKKGSAKSAGSWLGRTIDSLRERVATAEAKVEAFRTQNGLFLVGGAGDNSNISSQQLSELNTQLAAARSQQAELTSKARMIREAVRQGRIFEVSDIVNNEVVRRLIETRATLKAQIAQEERTLLPQHPRIKELYAQLAGLEEQVRSAAERTSRTLENDARAAGARVVANQAELDQQKRQSGNSNEQEVQLRALEREAKAEREQLETYLGRYRDASVRDTDNAVTADARVVSRAIAPSTPSFPKKLPIIIIATLAGFAISLFWILTKALLSDRVYGRRMQEAQPAAAPAMPYPTIMLTPQMMAMMAQGMMPQQAVASAASASQAAPATEMPITTAKTEASAVQTAQTPLSQSAAQDMSEASRAMRESLNRMTEVLNPPSMTTPLGRLNAPRMETAPTAVPELKAPPLQPRSSDLNAPLNARGPLPLGGITWQSDLSDQTRSRSVIPASAALESDNPLFEIADEAEAALIRGRPVSILILSVEGADRASGTVRALEAILKGRGTALSAVLEATKITPEGLVAAAKSLAGQHDYVIFNGGAANDAAAALTASATLTVLVAEDGGNDDRFLAAEQALGNASYFIVAANSADELAIG
jgi:polysaccharide biosynthesis transport protein